MTRTMCDREAELLTALRAGATGDALLTHLAGCSPCQQTQRAATLMLRYADDVRMQAEPPSAARVWRRAQLRRREVALHRATEVMLAMRVLGLLYLLGMMMWALRMLWQTQPEQGRRAVQALGSGTVPLGVGATVVLLLAGASCLMFFGRRQSPPLLR